MMAITTNNSINVKAELGLLDAWERRMGQTHFPPDGCLRVRRGPKA
jgi:hypothetical protein